MAKLSGGSTLKAKLAELSAKVDRASTLSVGYLEGATYPDGTPVAAVAWWNEIGDPAKGRPPRPSFRQMISAESAHWGRDLGGILKANGYAADKALGLMGIEIKEELQDSIRNFTDPPLAPSTIARKGFDKPLVDTGHMLNSVDFKVET